MHICFFVCDACEICVRQARNPFHEANSHCASAYIYIPVPFRWMKQMTFVTSGNISVGFHIIFLNQIIWNQLNIPSTGTVISGITVYVHVFGKNYELLAEPCHLSLIRITKMNTYIFGYCKLFKLYWKYWYKYLKR